MKIQWSKEKGAARDIQLFLAWIDRHVERKEGSGCSSKVVGAFERMDLLASLVQAPSDIPASVVRGRMANAISRVPPGEPLSPDRVLAQLTSLIAVYRRRRPEPFILVTTASLRLPARRVVVRRDRDVSVTLSWRRPRRFTLPPSLLEQRDDYAPRGYCSVQVKVLARCSVSACERALAELDYVRGLWNLTANRTKGARWSSSPHKKPVNEVLLGPVHTIHRPDGSFIEDAYWVEVPCRWQEPSELLTKHRRKLRSAERWLRQRIKRIAYRPDFADIVVRYTRALDVPDMVGSFLKLWVVMEQLVLGGPADGYATVARRASFVFRDHDFHAAVLRRLAAARNEIVHRSDAPQEAEALVFELKGYVEGVLRFMLTHPSRFASRAEFDHFLDLPRSDEELKRRLEIHRFAHRIRTQTRSAG